MMKPIAAILVIWILTGGAASAQNIKVNPIGVNTNPNSGSTAFLTYGQIPGTLQPGEAIWCGELISAAPDLGLKCDPSTIFGSLPARYNLSKSSGSRGFTDVMSIPPSVARRAYQAAADGAESRFYYVRHFVNTGAGPDEYVVVTCRLASGGARTPFALTDVQLLFEPNLPIALVRPMAQPPKFNATIQYNGTGRLRGRWEVVMPGEELPTDFDLLPEGSLPYEERGKQRRYTQLSRFNIFLPPVGRFVLEGPDAGRLPRTIEGPYMVLLRIEATDDREADSDLSLIGVGPGVVHSGALAGFALPVLRYFVGSGESRTVPAIALTAPIEDASIAVSESLVFAWIENAPAAFVRLEITDRSENALLNALLPTGTRSYRAPAWLRAKTPDGSVRWRVVGFDESGNETGATAWRRLAFRIAP